MKSKKLIHLYTKCPRGIEIWPFNLKSTLLNHLSIEKKKEIHETDAIAQNIIDII